MTPSDNSPTLLHSMGRVLKLPLRAIPAGESVLFPHGVPAELREAEYDPYEYDLLCTLARKADAAPAGSQERAEAVNSMNVMHELKVLLGARVPPEVQAREKAEASPEQFELIPPEGTETILRVPDTVRSRMRGELPGEARARQSDPWTSHAAAHSIPPEALRASQKAVLGCFERNGPMHDERFLETYRAQQAERGWPEQSDSGLRSRRDELVDAGYMADSGDTFTLGTGRASKVWRAA